MTPSSKPSFWPFNRPPIWAIQLMASVHQIQSTQGQILNNQAQILALLQTTNKEITTLALDISALTTAVTNETTVEQSAITLISGLAAQIQTLINASGNTVDPVALQALVDQMTTSQKGLAAAVAANQAPAPPTPPAPTPAGS